MSRPVGPVRPQRASRSPHRPKPERRFARPAGYAALALVVLVSGVFAYVLWTLRDLPDPGQKPLLGSSIVVYDRNGKQLEQRNASGQYYDPVKLDQMGKLVPAATLAAEDRNFYHHGAIDYGSTARAAFEDVIHHGYAQGGSTITQQLVKIDVLSPQKSIFRKMQEAVLATALEQRYSKDQILEMYLNRVYYGHNAYGIGAATKVYFGADKEPKDLTVAQAAFLAGLINGPAYFDPLTHYDRAKARQQYVLDGMVKTGAITDAQAAQAAQENVKADLKFDQSFRRSLAPHFVDYIVERLETMFGASAVQHGGFAVYTTLDANLQAAAQKAVSDGVAKLKYTGVNNGDLLAADPRTGAILAWVGSADYYDNAIAGQFDVIRSPRQPGSSFKPYVYEAALKDHKITLASTLQDKPTDFGNGYRPLDFDNRFMGPMSARRALVLSRNVPAVEVGQMEGISNVINLAHAMGIKSQLQDVPSTAIGASDVTMFEQLQGYQVFADQGTLMPLVTITKVVGANGETLYSQDPGKQSGSQHPLTPADAYLITDTLKQYQYQWDLGWGRQMAGKSGTTGGSATGIHNDAWMMGYNPDIVVGAWAGNTGPGGQGHTIRTFGTEVGQEVLAPFINGLPANLRDWYHQPDGIVSGSGCPGDRGGREIFLTGTQNGVNCPPPPTPTPTPSPTATPTPSPTPTPTPRPTPSPIGTPCILNCPPTPKTH